MQQSLVDLRVKHVVHANSMAPETLELQPELAFVRPGYKAFITLISL